MPAWLALALDQALPDLTGGERDAVARAILAAIPLSVIELAIERTAPIPLGASNVRDASGDLAARVAAACAPAIANALSGRW